VKQQSLSAHLQQVLTVSCHQAIILVPLEDTKLSHAVKQQSCSLLVCDGVLLLSLFSQPLIGGTTLCAKTKNSARLTFVCITQFETTLKHHMKKKELAHHSLRNNSSKMKKPRALQQ
jgi:hypothetical protein